ncbi:hypothetical protein R6Q57_005012 [Mikania cordata]
MSSDCGLVEGREKVEAAAPDSDAAHDMMAAYYPTNVTTDHIQQYLDENKSLILKIVESQNSGKIAECAEHQAKLQRNLMYLAAIADSQPQAPTHHSQPPGGHYMQQHQQTPLQAVMATRSSMMYSQLQHVLLQQQHAMHSQLGMSPNGGTSTIHMPQTDNSNAAGGFGDLGRKQDVGGGSSGGDGGETVFLQSLEKGN